MSRIEIVQNQGMQDPRLEIGLWAFAGSLEDGSETVSDVPTTDDFNSVEAGAADFYDYKQPADQD